MSILKQRITVTLDRAHPAAATASLLMGLAAGLRLWYFLSGTLDAPAFVLRLLLPVSAAVLFIIGNFLGGRRFRPFSIAAVALGVAFFIAKAAVDFSPLHQGLCTLLYVTVITVYTLTVTGVFPTVRLLVPLFGLPLLYHLFVEDTQAYFFADPPVPVWEWIPEISVLCIMGALLCQSFAMNWAKK